MDRWLLPISCSWGSRCWGPCFSSTTWDSLSTTASPHSWWRYLGNAQAAASPCSSQSRRGSSSTERIGWERHPGCSCSALTVSTLLAFLVVSSDSTCFYRSGNRFLSHLTCHSRFTRFLTSWDAKFSSRTWWSIPSCSLTTHFQLGYHSMCN